MNHREDTAKTV